MTAQDIASDLAGRVEVPATTEAGTVAVPSDPVISMLERVVMDRDLPIERLERVIAMKERMEDRAREDEDRQARRAYFAAMAQCQVELPVVTRNLRNDHTKSNYADLAAIETQAMPIIHKHGFAVSFRPAGYTDKGEQRIAWHITHADGHSESDVAALPVDVAGSQGKVNKTGIQAFGSTTTYARRYLLCMLFNISTGGDNDGNTLADTITEEQAEELKLLIDRAVAARPDTSRADWIEAFLAYMRVSSLNEIDAKDFGKAKSEIEHAIRQGKK